MPYTPPSLSSPSASYQSSPPRSPAPRPNLPRSNSSSYLSKHRRSPSWQLPRQEPPCGYVSAEDGTSRSLRQSPPPVTDASIPAGAIMSPPDSTQNSSDDDEPVPNKADRDFEGRQELEEAVRRLDTNRVPGSPPAEHYQSRNKLDLHLDLPKAASDHGVSPEPRLATPPRPSSSARKVSHSRSATESSLLDMRNTQSAGASLAGSDESDDDDIEENAEKPTLLRKKSGELVKPAIRPTSRRKHSSMPGTPTYSKAVHFNDDIEQVRHFLQVDKPIAVSAGTSPAGEYEDETEFPFSPRGCADSAWSIRLANFPRETFERLNQPVRLEKLFLSADQKSLIGSTAAANLAFHKQVVARFTLDYWETTSEVTAEFNNDSSQALRTDGYDPFTFCIKLSDQANLESKTLFICVRYNVNGQEFWDNNGSMNYQVDFVRSRAAKGDGTNNQEVQSKTIPRSKQNSPASQSRNASSYDEDFAAPNSDPASMIRFRSNAPGRSRVPGGTRAPKNGSSGQQFSSRYDFGASLSAALSHAQEQMGATGNSRSYGRESQDTSPPDIVATSNQSAASQPIGRAGHIPPANSGNESPRPDALLANKQPLDSRAYREFVSRFCFFGTSKATNQPAHPRAKTYDGADGNWDDAVITKRDHPAPSADPNASLQAGVRTAPPDTKTVSGGETRLHPDAPRSGSWGFPFPSESRSGTITPEPAQTIIQG